MAIRVLVALVAGLLSTGATVVDASAAHWSAYLGQWQTASKPAYQDTFHIELQVVQLQRGYSLTWTQRFAAYPPRELRQAKLTPDTERRWTYSATAATGRTREGAAWFDHGDLHLEYREHDPSGHSARIFETFSLRGAASMESARMIWREGGWQPLTTESWWRFGQH